MQKHIHHGWIVAIAGFFVIAMNAMALLGFGVFLKPLTEEFGWDRGDLSSAFSIAVLLGGILSLVSGRLSDRFGPRILIITGGLALGAGFMATSLITELWHLYFAYAIPVGITIASTVIPINATIPRWFTRGRGLALAIPAMGFSVGGVIAPLVIEKLIESVGWQQTFLILGILPFIITIPLGLLMKNPPEEEKTENQISQQDGPANRNGTMLGKLPVTKVLKDKWVWLFGGMQFSFGFSTQMILVHIAPYGTDMGLSPAIAAGILSFSSAIGIFGSLGAGSFSDKMNARLLLTISFSLLTVSLILLLFAESVSLFYIFAFIFGFARGSVALLQTITAVDFFGVRNFGFYMGTFLLFGTIGGVVGTPVAGYIFDASGSYSVAFWMAVITGIAAMIISIIVYRHNAVKM